MPDQETDTNDEFVEIDGVKYQQDPENPEEALKGEDGEFVPFEEPKDKETDEEKEKREKKEEEERKKEEDEEPPTRRGAKDWIIDRQKKKIKKLKEGEFGGEEELSPESRDLIKEEIEEKVKPVLEAVRSTSDSQELQDVLNKYPEAKPLEKQIKKYMEHPAYKNTSVEFIFWGLAAKKMKLQKKKDEKDEEAKGSETGGHQRKTAPKGEIPDVRNMPDKDFEDLVFKVKSGQKF